MPTSIYMNWGGTTPPEIRGDVTEAGHLGWIELFSAQFGVGRGTSSPTGRGNGPTVSEMVVTKARDLASHALFRECMYGEGKKVLIDFVKDDGGKPKVYNTITLSGVLLNACGMNLTSAAASSEPMESFTLTFTKAEYGPSAGVQPHTPIPHQNPAFWNIRPPAR